MQKNQVEAYDNDDFTSRRCMLDDLQLAAELGKTLLERNKELETALRQHQNVVEDQAQEIEYLTKQTVALREVNDSRLRIYEQLEVSIQDLERANHRLAIDHANDKKHIKSLCSNIETLEGRGEELQKTIEDLKSQLDVARRRAERKAEPPDDRQKQESKPSEPTETKPQSPKKQNSLKMPSPIKTLSPPTEMIQEHEDLLRISDELRENKVAFAQEHRRVTELEEQLASIVQENNRLQEQLREWNMRDEEPKSMHEEFSILEEVRQGQVCIRCLRGVERTGADDMSSMLDDDDDRSGISSLLLTATPADSPTRTQPNKFLRFENGRDKLLQGIWSNNQDSNDNPYRELVQKYEALLEVQLSQVKNIRRNKATTDTNSANVQPLSLHEELQTSGDFTQFNIKDTDDESGQGEEQHKNAPADKTAKPEQASRKKFAQTPDFSEAETSSSGFSDETSNKATQTEKERPGSFLCTIADGEDYRFSIYDDASPMDGHFRNRPEYRELFKEIFTILKKAAESKDEGEILPLLDDSAPPVKVPPVTPAHEEAPCLFTDDTHSVLSSVMSEQSIPLSDNTTPDHTLKEADITITDELVKNTQENEKNNELEQPQESVGEKPHQPFTPLVRQPLEYIAATRKKSRHRRKHSADRQGADSPVFPSPPRIIYQKSGSGRKRRDYRPVESSPLAKNEGCDWNGTTVQFYNRSVNSPAPGGSGARQHKVYQSWNPETDTWETKQSTASQEIHKLRKLELSYAEVLRNADKTKGRRKKHP